MTTTTSPIQNEGLDVTAEGLELPVARRRSGRLRFVFAFVIGLFAAMALGVGALYAYDQQHIGKVLPGVRMAGLDLGGMTPEAASAALEQQYAYLGEGTVVVHGPDGDIEIPYAEAGRRADVAAMVGEALAIGRSGNALERMVADARTAVRGVTLSPRVTFDPEAVSDRLSMLATSLRRVPAEASVTVDKDAKFVITPGAIGREADASGATAAILTALGDLNAPSTIKVDLAVSDVAPAVTTEEAESASAQAERLAGRLSLQVGEEQHKIDWWTLHRMTSFRATADGGYEPVVDTTGLPDILKGMAKKIDQPAINASFKTSGGRITGVTKSQDGYKMDAAATATLIQQAIEDRREGANIAAIEPALKVTEPVLTTAEAKAAAPKMRKISSWTTYFPISEKNGFGNNIWIPALDIDGYVVAPRATFDFWNAVGPISRARGYRDGGAIINGRTEPQGALAGGICSCSTTLFNAALRAGFEMGARRNHYYYIDRYPLGLDATVFKSGSGSVQTMSWTNDTDYPVLIRGYRIRDGSAGYVKFELYSVPNGRRVSFSRPIVRDVRPASDTVQMTSSLPPGARKRIEYPVAGKKVWVTRTVRDRDGNVIHRETYYSNYARITGIVLVGRGNPKPAAPKPDPSSAPPPASPAP